jgi:DNA-binding response OmpR family regulator
MIAEGAPLYHPFSHMEHQVMPSPQRFRYRLLYVGADLDLFTFLQGALKDEGWFVVRCCDGGMALLLLRSGIGYHLLLFDEDLPDMSGRELALRMRAIQQRRGVPLILLSAKDGAEEARRAGVSLFLQPTRPFRAVVEAIRRLHRASVGE